MRETSPVRRRAAAVAAALAASAASVLLVVLLGERGSSAALGVGTALTGGWGLAGALVLLPRAVREGRAGRFRLAGGLAALLYGSGQVLLASAQLRAGGAVPFPATGDLVSLTASPFALALVALLPRPGGTAGRLPRLLPDALVVAAAGALLVWRTVFLGTRADFPASMTAATALLVELLLVALLVQLAVVAFDAGPAVLGAGVAVLASGDAATSWAALQGGTAADWVTVLGSAAAWPLIIAGLVITRAARRGLDGGARAEARASLTTVSLLGVGAAALAATLVDGRVDAVSIVLLGVLVSGAVTRELVLQRQRVLQVAALSAAADHDPLTGLANRRALRAALRAATTGTGPIGVVVLDLDGFKAVNDRLGHSTGDALIVAVARAIAPLAGAGTAARLGGDEFALLLPAAPEQVDAVAGHLAEAVRACAATVPGVASVRVSASIGVVTTTAAELAAGTDAFAVVSRASAAMQEAKRSGRDRVVRYGGAVAAASSRRGALEARLRRALEHGELDIHLQPAVDATTGRVGGFEAFVRWDDAELGAVAPAELIPVAERTGLVRPLGRHVLRLALEALAALPGDRLRVSVNASVVELRSPEYADDVAAALLRAGVAAQRLSLDVTEDALLHDEDPALDSVRALAELGVGIVVDDFGRGSSSLGNLARLPLSCVKLDTSLVAGLAEPRTRAVVTAAVAVASSLGLAVVAEGVEDAEQRAALLALGVRGAQGRFWSPPLSRAAAAALAATPGARLGAATTAATPA